MVATDKVFSGSIPELYDHYLVPLIFEAYASDLAARIRLWKANPEFFKNAADALSAAMRANPRWLPSSSRNEAGGGLASRLT